MFQSEGGSPDLMVETSGLFLAFACVAACVLGSAGLPVVLPPVSVRWSPAGSWTLNREGRDSGAGSVTYYLPPSTPTLEPWIEAET